MSVLEGPRKEVRHVMKDGSELLGRVQGRQDCFCRRPHLPKRKTWSICRPARRPRYVCVHVNYISRYYEFNNTRVPPKTPTYFQKPLTALNAHKGELIKPAGYKYVNYEGEMAARVRQGHHATSRARRRGTASRASHRRTISAATTSATPTQARCCG